MSTPRTLDFGDLVRREEVETDRGRFAALRSISGETSLAHGRALLIPGWTGSKEDFGTLLPLLAAAGWDAATYDQRGQFESPAEPEDDFTLTGFAADARAFTTTVFGDNERVHLVGHSFGGLVSTAAVLEHEDLWASVTLMCSGPGGLSKDADDLLHHADRIVSEGLETAYRDKVKRDRDRGMPQPPAEVERFLHQRFLANSPESLAAMTRLLADAPDRTADLAGLGLRKAVLRGADDDAWPHDVQDRLAHALGTTVVVIADAAHSPAVEQPEATRDALARIWLR